MDASVERMHEQESRSGVCTRDWYGSLQGQADRIRTDLIRFLEDSRQRGMKVVAYGAAAKGNTLLNFAGVNSDLIEYVVDRNPAKQGQFMPGSRIPILSPDAIERTRPDYLLVLPWNLIDEIMLQLAGIRSWDGRFVTAVPELKVQ